MSIFRDMKLAILEKKEKVQQPSGAWKEEWVTDRNIDLAIYPANNVILTSSNVKYSESTNTGLTTEKVIVEVKNRINDNGQIYDITFANPAGKYTQLYLKKVVPSG